MKGLNSSGAEGDTVTDKGIQRGWWICFENGECDLYWWGCGYNGSTELRVKKVQLNEKWMDEEVEFYGWGSKVPGAKETAFSALLYAIRFSWDPFAQHRSTSICQRTKKNPKLFILHSTELHHIVNIFSSCVLVRISFVMKHRPPWEA